MKNIQDNNNYMKKNFYNYKSIQISLIIFVSVIITSFLYSLIQGHIYFLLLIILYLIWIYILLNIDRTRIIGLSLIILPMIIPIMVVVSFMSFPNLIHIFIYTILSFIKYAEYIYSFLGIIAIVFIYYKKQIFTNILFLTLLILFLNINFVFEYNKHYYHIYPDKANQESLLYERYAMSCQEDIVNNSLLEYNPYIPKSNLFLPTLGIRYKDTYEEERGIMVVYEKRSYFNLYVGDGKALCANDGGLETLE